MSQIHVIIIVLNYLYCPINVHGVLHEGIKQIPAENVFLKKWNKGPNVRQKVGECNKQIIVHQGTF